MDLDATLRRADAAAPTWVTEEDPRHPLHPRPVWVRDGIQPHSRQYDLQSYADLMETINDYFVTPGREREWGMVAPAAKRHKALPKPKKGQTQEELKRQREGKPADHMNLSTRGKALFARRLLILWWKNPQKTNWSRTMIKKWETKTVRALLDQYHVQVHFVPGLDDHLPADLKKRMMHDSE